MLRPAASALHGRIKSSNWILNSVSIPSTSSTTTSTSTCTCRCNFCSSSSSSSSSNHQPHPQRSSTSSSSSSSSSRFGSPNRSDRNQSSSTRNRASEWTNGSGNGNGQQSRNMRKSNGNGNERFRDRNSQGQKSSFGSNRQGGSEDRIGQSSNGNQKLNGNQSSLNAFSNQNQNRFRQSNSSTASISASKDSEVVEEISEGEPSMDAVQDFPETDSPLEDSKSKRKKFTSHSNNPSSSKSKTSSSSNDRPSRSRLEESSKRDGHRAVGINSSLLNKKKVKKDDKETTKVKKEPRVRKEVFLPNFITTNNLARLLGIKMRTLQNKMTEIGLTDTRPDLLLSFSDSELLASEYDLTAIVDEEASFDIYPRPEPTSSSEEATSRPLRPPVVTIMGHVDHGKTTLLDKLRSTSIAIGEAGGITQHIGAFSVPVGSASGSSKSTKEKKNDGNEVKTITFLDTPGHAAFAAMRSRGASVTDIVVLVCAADDGVMPQTKEVIQLVKELNEEAGSKNSDGKKSGGVQLVVALSKIDKPDSEPDRVKRELLSAGVELEEFGGEIPCVPVSGKTGEGLVELEETVAVLSELSELRSEREGLVEGYVLESRIEKGRGNIATVLVKRGKLKVGDSIVAGLSWAKVRSIVDINNKSLREAFPCDPVLITGWKDLPSAGDELLGAPDESSAKRAIDNRKKSEERRKLLKDVENINEGRRLKAQEDEAKEIAEFEERQRRRALRQASNDGTVARDPVTGAPLLSDEEIEMELKKKELEEAEGKAEVLEYRLIIKADFSGTAEAVIGAIESIGNQEAKVKIVSSGVGDVTEGDVAMAQAIGGHILGFNVKAPRSIQQQASRLQPQVEIHCDDVIYRLMSYTTDKVAGLLPPRIEKRVTGEAQIAQVFPINVKSRIFKNIAGCKITNGIVSRNTMVRVLRSGEDLNEGDEEAAGRKVVFEGKLDTLKHLKKDVNEMRKGTECGMAFDGFEDFKVDDVVQCFNKVEVPRTL